jgi:low density lipoprotein receptor-related protein 5/6
LPHIANYAEGLAWDWINEKLYWTDSNLRKIEVFDPDTEDRKLLFDTGVSTNPADLVLDPING